MSTKPSMPAQPTTVSLPAMTDRAILEDLARTLKAGMERMETVDSKVDALVEHVELLHHDAKDTRLRLGRMEREIDEVKSRQQTNSLKVKSVSENDLAQEAAIADVLQWRAKVTEDVSELKTLIVSNTEITAKSEARAERIEKAVTGLWDSRGGKLLRALVWAALIAWLASKGIK